MLASITPLGERSRHSRWSATALIFIAAASLGATLLGALAGLAGELALSTVGTRWRIGLVAAALACGAVAELWQFQLPGPRRQVNEGWLASYRRWVYAAGFGGQLGAGVLTIVVSSAVYAVYVTAFAAAAPLTGAAIGATAGALRGASLLAGWSLTTPGRLVAFHARMTRLGAPARRSALSAQLLLSGCLLCALLS